MLVSIPLIGRAHLLTSVAEGRYPVPDAKTLPMVSQLAYLLVLMHRCAVENVDKIGIFFFFIKKSSATSLCSMCFLYYSMSVILYGKNL
jgi:hypothetical protein